MKEYIFEFPGVNHASGVRLAPAISRLTVRNHTFKQTEAVVIQIEVKTGSGFIQAHKGSLMSLNGVTIHLESKGLSKALFIQVWPSDSVGRLVIEAE